jgi:hypothetical protein
MERAHRSLTDPSGVDAERAIAGPGKHTRTEALGPVIQRRAVAVQGPVQVPGAPATGGAPLPADLRARMEGSFGADFAGVRVHQDDTAGAMGAAAYARGENLHFAPGKYDPDSEPGRELIGHELAHVVQQRQGRAGAGQAKGGIADDPALEREADQQGARAARGEPAGAGAATGTATGAIQRKQLWLVDGTYVDTAQLDEATLRQWITYAQSLGDAQAGRELTVALEQGDYLDGRRVPVPQDRQPERKQRRTGGPEFGQQQPGMKHGYQMFPGYVMQQGHGQQVYPQQQYGYPQQQQYGYPQQQYGYPQQQYGYPQQQYGYPQQQYGYPQQQYGYPQQQHGYPQQQHGHTQPQGLPQVTVHTNAPQQHGEPEVHQEDPPKHDDPPVEHGEPSKLDHPTETTPQSSTNPKVEDGPFTPSNKLEELVGAPVPAEDHTRKMLGNLSTDELELHARLLKAHREPMLRCYQLRLGREKLTAIFKLEPAVLEHACATDQLFELFSCPGPDLALIMQLLPERRALLIEHAVLLPLLRTLKGDLCRPLCTLPEASFGLICNHLFAPSAFAELLRLPRVCWSLLLDLPTARFALVMAQTASRIVELFRAGEPRKLERLTQLRLAVLTHFLTLAPSAWTAFFELDNTVCKQLLANPEDRQLQLMTDGELGAMAQVAESEQPFYPDGKTEKTSKGALMPHSLSEHGAQLSDDAMRDLARQSSAGKKGRWASAEVQEACNAWARTNYRSLQHIKQEDCWQGTVEIARVGTYPESGTAFETGKHPRPLTRFKVVVYLVDGQPRVFTSYPVD